MKFLAILLLFAYAYASASASDSGSSNPLGVPEKRASSCRIGSCTDSVNYFFASCGVDTIIKDLPCFCSLPASYYDDAFNCIAACGGDDTFDSVQEYYNYYCSSVDTSSGDSSDSDDSNALLFNSASSDHLISLIGLLVPLLI